MKRCGMNTSFDLYEVLRINKIKVKPQFKIVFFNLKDHTRMLMALLSPHSYVHKKGTFKQIRKYMYIQYVGLLRQFCRAGLNWAE